jgi:hypothetical protein
MIKACKFLACVSRASAEPSHTRACLVAVASFFNDRDMNSCTAVAVLGKTVANTLFPKDPDSTGNYLLMRNVSFDVIGIMSEKGASSWGGDQDDTVFIPVSTRLVRLFGQSYLSGITLKVSDLSQVDARGRTHQDGRRARSVLVGTGTCHPRQLDGFLWPTQCARPR